jgi:hypothetical protein
VKSTIRIKVEIIIFLAIGSIFICWQPLSYIYDFVNYRPASRPINLYALNAPEPQKTTVVSQLVPSPAPAEDNPVFKWAMSLWPVHYVEAIIFMYKSRYFFPFGFVDYTPPPFIKTKDNPIVIGPQGPFFMMVKSYTGEKDYGGAGHQGDKVQFEIMEGTGVIKPLLPDGTVSESLITPGLYTFPTDERGEVRAAFYPSPSNNNSEYYIVATVVNNPKLTNRIEFFWKTSPLNDQDFHDTIQKFVDWHNQTRLIDRTEQVVDYPDYSFFTRWEEVYLPQPAAPYTLTVRNGVYEDRGNVMPSNAITYNTFLQLTGRQPWGVEGNNIILYSESPDGSFVLWFYDKDDGVLTERITIPSARGNELDCSEADMEYQNINGTLFQSSQLYRIFSGHKVTSKSLSKMTVTLAPDDKGEVPTPQ